MVGAAGHGRNRVHQTFTGARVIIEGRVFCVLSLCRIVAASATTLTREIREASSPAMCGHFACISQATAEYTAGVWWAFYMRIMDTSQWPLPGMCGVLHGQGT
jgi:hypothetical protein